jgi:uncharacterized protein (DUF736 family)
VKHLYLLAALFLTGNAYAQTCAKVADNKAHICVTAPTQFTDNTPIPTGTTFTYKYFQQAGTAWNQVGSNTTGDFISAALAPGTYTFRVTATVAGAESDPSSTASKTSTQQSPNPPTMTIAELQITIPLDSQDGFKRTPVFTITAGGPGVLLGFCKVGTPSVADAVFSYRGQSYCKPLLNHPRTGAPNVAWVKGVTPSQDVASPCV